MKIKILSILLKEIRDAVTSEQFKRIELAILDAAESTGDVKIIAAAKVLRMILEETDYE